MKIGNFTDTYFPQVNGVVTSMNSFKKELSKHGHEIIIFAPRVKKQTPAELKDDRLNKIYRFFSIPYFKQMEHRFIIPFFSKLMDLKKYKLDIIHTQSHFTLGLYATHLGKKYNIPVVHTYHTLWAEYNHYSFLPPKLSRIFFIKTSKYYCDWCDLVISPSQVIKDVLLEYGVRRRIEVVPSGLDMTVFENLQKKDIRKQYGISDHSKILTFVGRLGIEKNLPFLFRAFDLIQKQWPEIVLLIVGDSPEGKGLKSYAADLKLDHKIIFTGYLNYPDVLNAVKNSDLFVFSSQTETQGIVVVEAAALGIPTVAVDAMGVAEILRGNKGGLLTAPDEGDFADKVLRLLNNPEIYQEKVNEALALAKDFSIENVGQKMIKAYQSML